MSDPETVPFLSLVIPAYNEAERLPATLDALQAYLAGQSYRAEVIVADDGSTDATLEVARARAATWSAAHVVSAPHRGKGHAVKQGVLASHGAYVFFCDADLSMPIEELGKLLPETLGAFDVAIASREGPSAHRYHEPLYRHMMGRIFNTIVRWVVLPGIQDSQCGFKCLRGDLARALAQAQTLDGWGFDVELLRVARLWGYSVVEVPIAWYYAASSRVHPLRDSWRMVREVLAVWRNVRAQRYGPRPASLAGTVDAPVSGGVLTPHPPLPARRGGAMPP